MLELFFRYFWFLGVAATPWNLWTHVRVVRMLKADAGLTSEVVRALWFFNIGQGAVFFALGVLQNTAGLLVPVVPTFSWWDGDWVVRVSWGLVLLLQGGMVVSLGRLDRVVAEELSHVLLGRLVPREKSVAALRGGISLLAILAVLGGAAFGISSGT
jgi:hypothetical protein